MNRNNSLDTNELESSGVQSSFEVAPGPISNGERQWKSEKWDKETKADTARHVIHDPTTVAPTRWVLTQEYFTLKRPSSQAFMHSAMETKNRGRKKIRFFTSIRGL
jgi:hypothetical protein